MQPGIYQDAVSYLSAKQQLVRCYDGSHSIFTDSSPLRRVTRRYWERSPSVGTKRYGSSWVYPTNYHSNRLNYAGANADYIVHTPTLGRVYRGPSDMVQDFGTDFFSARMPFGQVDCPSYLVAEADNRALSGVQINMAENLASFKQTLSTMSSLTVTGFELLTKFRKATKKLRDPKKVAEIWLQYQYGIKPIISDICALQGLHFGAVPFTTSRGEASDQCAPIQPANSAWEVLSVDDSSRIGCNTEVAYAISSPSLAAMNALGLANPLLLLWELTPFSFVVDWFINVGNVLESLSQGVGLTFLWGYRTRWLKTQHTVTWRPALAPGETFVGTPKSAQVNGKCYIREVLTFFPVPPLVWYPRLNLTKLSIALALAVQLKKA